MDRYQSLLSPPLLVESFLSDAVDDGANLPSSTLLAFSTGLTRRLLGGFQLYVIILRLDISFAAPSQSRARPRHPSG
jgi:hypothetical protein